VNLRFGPVSEPVTRQITAVTDVDILRQLLHQAALAETAEAFQNKLTELTDA
jgi:hypothetical protein